MTTQQIWTQLSDHLLNFIVSKVPVREDAEDILLEVFEKVHVKHHQLKEEDKLESWIFQITRNTINDYYKASNKNIANIEPESETKETSAEEELLTKLQRCMVNMMGQLPEKYQQPLILSELEGKKQQEVATQIGISLPGVKSRIQRGRTMLKDLLVACCKVDINEKRQIKAGSVTEMACDC